jgi:PAS domain-containing protein
VSEERREKPTGEQRTVRGAAYQLEMQRQLARLNLKSRAFTDAMRADSAERRLVEEGRERLLESERASHAETERARRKARAILESISDAYFALDQERRFVYVNRLAERFWDTPREELLGKNIRGVFPQAVGTESYQAIERAAKEGVGIEFEMAFPVLPGSLVARRTYPSAEGL